MSIMDAMDKAQVGFERRLRTFHILSLCLLVLLVGRLWQLQVIRGDHYANRASANRLALLPISAPRGLIVDRNGEVLATSRMAYTISVVPGEFEDRERELALLSEILGIPVDEIEEKISGQTQGKHGVPYQPARLVEDASNEIVLRVSEHRVDLPGIIIEEEPYRSYPKGELAGPLIGYVGQINVDELKQLSDQGYRGRDRIGKSGLERAYEDALRGQDGVTQVEVDSLSRPRGTLGMTEPIAGNTLELTIDWNLQRAAEEALRKQIAQLQAASKYKNARAGAVVAMDPRTGAILALASEPGYDPGWFIPRISEDKWRVLNGAISGLFNRAVSGAYPPGSVFKPFTAIAALEAGVVGLNEKFLCTPSAAARYYGKKCHIWAQGRSHGTETLIKGMADSCNIVFYELGRRLSADQMAETARAFGLGSPTGLKYLPQEASGAAPGSETREFMPGERLSYAIGQQVTVTPLQMAMAYSGIANRGKMYKPYAVQRIVAQDGSIVEESQPTLARSIELKASTWNYLHESTAEVVRTGTAAWAYRGFPIAVAGKTGSAQAPPGDSHAWFVGWAPANDPEIVVAVLVERGGGGGTASAPVARAIMEEYFAPVLAKIRSQGTAAGAIVEEQPLELHLLPTD